jgi:hypothetical protein
MKKIMRWVAVIVTLLTVGFVFAQASFAADSTQVPLRATGWAMGTSLGAPGVSVSGTEAMITEEGTVQKVEKVKGDPTYLQMTFKGEGGNLWTVFLGPKWFLDGQKIKIMPKDKVEVRGKKVDQYIIASEISKDAWTMKLRNEEDGFPNWDCCFPRKQ